MGHRYESRSPPVSLTMRSPKDVPKLQTLPMRAVRGEVRLDTDVERFRSQLLKTRNCLAYLEAAAETGPQLFIQLCIILKLGHISE